MLQAADSAGGVGDAVEDGGPSAGIRQAGHSGVIGIKDDRHGRRQTRQRLAPERGHAVHLTVAVELVTEEVSEGDDARGQGVRRFGQGRLVHLEHTQAALALRDAPLGIGGLAQGGGDAPHHVRAGAVVHRQVARRTRDVPHQPSGGCLAVGAGHQQAAVAELAYQARRQTRGHRLGHQAGQGGAAAEAQAATEGRRQLGRAHRRRRAHTRHCFRHAPLRASISFTRPPI